MCEDISERNEQQGRNCTCHSKSTTNPDVSEVRPLHIREKEFKPFAFTVNAEGLPEIAREHTCEQQSKAKSARISIKT